MKTLAVVSVLALAGCTTIKPFGEGAYVVESLDGPDMEYHADRYCAKQGKVLYVENETPSRLVFECRAAPLHPVK